MPFNISQLQESQMYAYAIGLIMLMIWEQINPFYLFFRTNKKKGLHFFKNLLLGGVNAVVISGLFVSLWAWASQWSFQQQVGLLHQLPLGTFAHAVFAIMLFDFWMYVWHRINHVIPFLWRFHRVHHSDPSMDVTTASRFHIGEIVLSSIFRIPIIMLLGVHLGELLLYETIAFAVVQLHHANITLSSRIDKLLRMLIISPYMHKIHHSDWQPETDSNYGSLFSFWDRLGRSFRMRSEEGFKDLNIGLKEFADERYETVKNLFKLPLFSIKNPELEETQPSSEKQQKKT